LASALSPDHADNFPDVFATAGIGSKSSRRMRRAKSGEESTTARSCSTGGSWKERRNAGVRGKLRVES
jgi:hypothetical protein